MTRILFPMGIIMENFLFPPAFSPTLESTQPPIQWVCEALFPGVKLAGRKVDHSPLSSAETENS